MKIKNYCLILFFIILNIYLFKTKNYISIVMLIYTLFNLYLIKKG